MVMYGFILTLNQPKHECLSLKLWSRSTSLIPLGRETMNNGPLYFDETHNCLELVRSSGVGIQLPGAVAGMWWFARS
jgi:hypothetical protein